MKIIFIIISITLLFTLSNANNYSQWEAPTKVPSPKVNPLTKDKIKLGKLLFFDKRLSISDDISCASCHDPKLGWSDGRAKSIGDKGRVGRRNSPTLMNSAYLNSFFHDSRAKSLEEQALGPIETEVEMNMPIKKLVQKLKNIEGYVELFSKAFIYEGITKNTILQAIASFERTIVSHETPFNRWINGEVGAISKEAQVGFNIFLNEGRCKTCHNSFRFTNERLANVGLGDENDLGVYELEENKIWYGAFKTPTLIDINKTAPYFHNGSVASLKKAVHICGNGGKKPVKRKSPFFRDRKLSSEEVDFIVSFLKTLSTEPLDILIPTEFPQ
jgi:cytochrome c peroxidase